MDARETSFYEEVIEGNGTDPALLGSNSPEMNSKDMKTVCE